MRGLVVSIRTLKGFIYQAVSADQGYTWSTAEASSLANPDAKIHLTRLADGMLAVAYNNHQKLKRPYRRCR
jgi:predicted neuraminidase